MPCLDHFCCQKLFHRNPMGRDINPVIFKNLKAFLGVFLKEVNF